MATNPAGRLRGTAALARPTATPSAALLTAGAATLFLIAGVLFPKRVLGTPEAGITGIATPIPTLSTYSALIVIGVAGLVATYPSWTRLRLIPVSMTLFSVTLLALYALAWDRTGAQTSGLLQLGSGVGAWAIGSVVGRRLFVDERAVRLFTTGLLAIVSLEAVVAFAQTIGVPINPMDADTAALMGDRVNGTLNHPNNLGKAMLISMIISLGLAGSPDTSNRRRAIAAALVALLPLALGQGRANVAAALFLLVLWALFGTGRRNLAVRLGIPLVAVAIVLPFTGTLIDRLQTDPEGGARNRLAEAAAAQISRAPLTGTGPNSFVTIVGDYDAVVGSGYPVHNAFLLTVAELGAVAGALFWLPVLGLAAGAWRARRYPTYAGAFATTILASLPGLYLVNATGWALLSSSLLPLWFFACGLGYAAIRLGKPTAADSD